MQTIVSVRGQTVIPRRIREELGITFGLGHRRLQSLHLADNGNGHYRVARSGVLLPKDPG